MGRCERRRAEGTDGRGHIRVSSPNGHDIIEDFEPGKDHIELNGYGFADFNDIENHLLDTGAGMFIIFDANNNIEIAGIHQVSASDFILA